MSSSPLTPVEAHTDPAIFRNERVLRTLLKRELKVCPTSSNYFLTTQTELKPGMRREVANWMLELCEEEGSSPQVFCLAINYLDRFLSACKIARTQLQLLGAVCVLVSWKVRGHSPITAHRLREYTDFTVSLTDLLVSHYLLIMCPSLAHITGAQRKENTTTAGDNEGARRLAGDCHVLVKQGLTKDRQLSWPLDITSTGLAVCRILIAVSSIMTTLRPAIESSLVPILRDTPSPSSSSSSSCHTSPLLGKTDSPLERVIEAVQKMTMSEKASVLNCMEKLEEIMQASLPPSPAASEEGKSPVRSHSSLATSSPLAPRALFSGAARPCSS